MVLFSLLGRIYKEELGNIKHTKWRKWYTEEKNQKLTLYFILRIYFFSTISKVLLLFKS